MNFFDFQLSLNSDCIIDLSLEKNDLANDDGLETAVLISLFTDQRVLDGEQPRDESRRGWWGDATTEIEGDFIGSKLWLFERGKQNNETALRFKEMTERCLEWLLTDAVATEVIVETEFIARGELLISIKITRPGKRETLYDLIWDGQQVKRG